MLWVQVVCYERDSQQADAHMLLVEEPILCLALFVLSAQEQSEIRSFRRAIPAHLSVINDNLGDPEAPKVNLLSVL